MADRQPTMSKDGRFSRHTAQGAPVSCNSRYATSQCWRKQKDSFSGNRLALGIAQKNLALLSPGAISTAHPCFLSFDTAKLGRPNPAYLRSEKNLQKFTLRLFLYSEQLKVLYIRLDLEAFI